MDSNVDTSSAISNVEYKIRHPKSDFNDYWDDILLPIYEIEYWKLMRRYNLTDLLLDIYDKFDYESVEKYMYTVNWSWNDRKTSPTIKQLKSNTLSLLVSIFSPDGPDISPAKCSSGGFSVSAYSNNNIPYKLKVEFVKRNGEIISSETKISTIRKKKLKQINKP